METTPMIYQVGLSWRDFISHPLRNEWGYIPLDDPSYGSHDSFPLFLKQEFNINIEHYVVDGACNRVTLTFKFEQDFILWELHQ